MSSWDGKSQTGLWGYKIFVITLRYAGLGSAYLLLRFVAIYYFIFARKSNQACTHYFEDRLGYSKWEAIKARYKNYYIFGQTLIDRVVVMAGLGKRFTFDFDGEEHLIDMVNQGKGGMLISAHIGNWEVAGHLLYRVKTKINVVMHEAETQKIKQFLTKAKGDTTMEIIVIKEDLSHVYNISMALQRGELICMHADRFMPNAKTIQVPFLGKNAPFPQGPFALAVGFKVPVSFVFAMKESPSHYHLSATPSKTYGGIKGGTKEGQVETALHDFVTEAEKVVSHYPLQWFNYYDFWNSPSTTTSHLQAVPTSEILS
jgi:predicted LPLAT superfamily acyltransferase